MAYSRRQAASLSVGALRHAHRDGGVEDDAEAEPLPDRAQAAAADVAQQPGLLAWLLSRLKARAFHANKLFASELLAVLLQQNAANQRFLGEADGVLEVLNDE